MPVIRKAAGGGLSRKMKARRAQSFSATATASFIPRLSAA